MILLALLSKRAYELDLKYQIGFDYGDSPTAIDLVWRGADMECKGLQWTVECAVNYINVKTGLNQVI